MLFSKARFGSCLTLLLVALLLGSVVACDDTDDYYPGPITVVPDTSYALSATPLPESARMATEKFLKQKQALDDDWSQFHQEFDEWRVGLTACHGSTVYEALRGFAVGFNEVTEQARGLPRNSHTLELADALIQAAEEEEAAYRTLRDRWQPNNLSFFEVVEQRRAGSASAQKQVEDKIDESREELEEAPSEAEVLEFSEAFDSLKMEWEGLHDDYDGLLKQAERLDPDELMARLSRLASNYGDIVDAIYALPSLDATDGMTDPLRIAAAAERSTLRSLSASLTPSAPSAPSDGEEPPPPLEEMEGTLVGLEETLEEMENSIAQSQSLLRETRKTIKELEDDEPAEDLAKLFDFENAYRRLLAKWSDFQGDYNDWQETEGGCDRIDVLKALDQFNLDFGELGRKVRDLPQDRPLLPVYTLMVDGVGREEGAIRALRNSWRPFTVDVFKAVDQERTNSDRLRRDANIALQGLTERFP